jgi:ankyrin repeat protein
LNLLESGPPDKFIRVFLIYRYSFVLRDIINQIPKDYETYKSAIRDSTDIYESLLKPMVPAVIPPKEDFEYSIYTETDRLPVLQFLLAQAGTDRNKRNNKNETAFSLAAELGNLAFVEEFVKQEKDDLNYLEALHSAVRSGQLEAVKFLLQNTSVKVTDQDSLGRTALHLAFRHQHVEVATYLVEEAPEVLSLEDVYGRNVFHYMMQLGRVDTSTLYKLAAQHNMTDREDVDRFNLLHFAAWHGQVLRK